MILRGILNIKDCESKMTSNETITIKKIETKILNSRKINVKVILEIESKVYSNEEIEVVSNIKDMPNIQVLSNTKTINSLTGSGTNKVYAKDTINIENEDELAEILKADIKIINKDIKISYNKVLAKADAKVRILYLTEDNKVKNVEALIPIMGFVDINNICDDSVCDVDYNIKNLIIKPNNADSHSIYVEAEIEIECSAYETKEINLIEDLYSVSSNLDFEPKEVSTMSSKQNIKDILNIREQD